MKEIILLLLLSALTSCVGTVAETDDPFTESSLANDIPLYFLGIQKAEAISDSRIEIFFLPASGGSGKYTYDLQVGNEPLPRSYSSDTLYPDYRGLLKITVKNLDRQKIYQLKVEVRDEGSSQQSDSKVIKTVTTFDNQVAIFDGIISAFNMPGQDGKDSIKIRWNPAKASSGFPALPSDPTSYEVIFLDSLKFTPGDFDLEKGPEEGRWKFQLPNNPDQIEAVIQGLPSKTKFYVRMRAIHRGSVDSIFKPKLRSEQNTGYITISTLSGSITDLDYKANSFTTKLAPGVQGLNAINTSWDLPFGVFDHYRLYYWKKSQAGDPAPALPEDCPNQYLSTGNVWCKKVDYNLSLASITGLTPYQMYGVTLILCATSTCSSSGDRARWADRTIITDPLTSTFSGINEILGASNLDEIGSVKIKFSTPDFSNGYFDGLILKVKRSKDDSAPSVEVLSSPTADSDVYFLPYNFLSDGQITVKGINYLEESPYCFNLYPFKWNAESTERTEFDKDMWECPVLKIEGPVKEQFSGLEMATHYGDIVTLNWRTPKSGIFAHYEVFWTKNSGTQFSWSDAITQTVDNGDYTNYGRRLIEGTDLEPDSENFLSLNLFADGVYSFGVLTYYNYITPNGLFVIRSETNQEVYKCQINSTLPIETRECVKN